MRNVIILLVLLINVPSSILFAQNIDNTWQNQQISNAVRFYDGQFFGPNSSVYEGYEYLPYTSPAIGNPYFDTNEWREGSVFFKGRVYNHLPLLYDILKDELVLQSWNKMYRILLSTQNVNWFTIGKHHFIRINNNDSSEKSSPSFGYYEELVHGPTMLLAKRIKTVVAPTTAGTTREFVEKDLFYIKKANRYYQVRAKRSVLRVLSDHRGQIKQYLRKNEINFSVNREAAMIEIVNYENRLNNKGE